MLDISRLDWGGEIEIVTQPGFPTKERGGYLAGAEQAENHIVITPTPT